jgi:hypothetical protein
MHARLTRRSPWPAHLGEPGDRIHLVAAWWEAPYIGHPEPAKQAA